MKVCRKCGIREALTYCRDYPGDPVHVHEVARAALSEEPR